MIAEVQVVSGAKLKKAIKVDASKAMDGCGASLTCIAKLGAKAKADEVLLGRATSKDGGVEILFVAVSVDDKAVARKLPLSFASLDGVKPVLGSAFYELFGITTPGSLTIAGATGQVRIDGEYLGNGPGPYELKPGRHEVSTGGLGATVTITPGATKKLKLSEMSGGTVPAAEAETPVASAPPQGDDALLDSAGKGMAGATPVAAGATPLAENDAPALVELKPNAAATAGGMPEDDAVALVAPPPRERPATSNDRGPPTWLTWAGVAGAGAGAVAIGVGAGAFYPKADATVERHGSDEKQLVIQRRNNAAMSAATTATVMGVAGGALAVIGAALIVIDLAFTKSVVTDIAVSPTGAATSATWRF